MKTIEKGIIEHSGYLYLQFTPTKYGRRQREALHLRDNDTNREKARKKLLKIEYAISLGMYERSNFFTDSKATSSPTDLEGYGNRWLNSKLQLSLRTQRNYTSTLNTWLSILGNAKLNTITLVTINTSCKKHGLSDKSINNYRGILSQILASAVKEKLITENPLSGVAKLRIPKGSKRIDPFTREEAEFILAHIQKYRHEQIYHFYCWQFFTGCRPSETVLLRWCDIDFVNAKAAILRAWDGSNEEDAEKETKTNVDRVIDLDDAALSILKAQKAHTFLSGDLVFTHPTTGGRINPEKFLRNYWNPTLKAVGVRRRVQYNCRHSFASWLLSEGLPVAYIAEQLGHASIQTTLQNYAKWMPQGNANILSLRNKNGSLLMKSPAIV